MIQLLEKKKDTRIFTHPYTNDYCVLHIFMACPLGHFVTFAAISMGVQLRNMPM